MKKHVRASMVVMLALLLGLLPMTGCLGKFYPKKTDGGKSGPVTSQPTGQADTAELDMLRQAERAANQGRKEDAVKLYQTFINRYPSSREFDTALIGLGLVHESMGQPNQALDAYQRLVVEQPNSRYALEAGHRLAPIYLNAGRHDSAVNLLTDMLKKTQKPEDKARLQILMGRAYLGKKSPGQAMDWFMNGYRNTTDTVDRDEARRGIKAAAASMTQAELEQAQATYGLELPGGYATYLLAYRLNEGGQKPQALEQLKAFNQNFPNHEMAPDAKALQTAIEGKGAAPKLDMVQEFGPAKTAPVGAIETTPRPIEPPIVTTGPSAGPAGPYKPMNIACLLPLSGSSGQDYAKRVQKGLELAFKTARFQTPGFKSDLQFYDTKGSPEEARRIVAAVAKQDNTLAVVGPLLSREATEAAKAAQESSLPMITVTQKNDITRTGPSIFRLFLTPEAQAEAVATYAVQVLGLKRLAVLYPEDTYGRTMLEPFKTKASALGAQVVKAVGYDPKKKEFSLEIQQLTGVGKAQKKVGPGKKVEVNFDAVFIPDSPRMVAMIAPQFAYHDIMNLRMLGTSLWHDPQLLSTSARYVQHCVIPTSFFPQAGRPEVQQFVQAYQQDEAGKNQPPNAFDAYGYDAGRLLLALMDQQHISNRDDLVNALKKVKSFPGVTGRFNFSSDGEYVVEPTLVTVEGEEFKLIQ